MNKAIPHITNNFKRYLLVFASFLLVLLTSCSVKTSIKTLIGIPLQSEHRVPKGNSGFTVTAVEKCAPSDSIDAQTLQKSSTHTNDLLPTVIYTVAFLFLLGLRPVSEKIKHPLYSGSGKIRNSIPIFLEYQKTYHPLRSVIFLPINRSGSIGQISIISI